MSAATEDSTSQITPVDLPPPMVPPYLGLAVATLAVSFSAILIKWSSAPPVAIAAYRMGLTTLCLLPLLRRSRRAALAGLDRRTLALLPLSGLLLALHFGFWTASLGMTSVASSVLFVSVHPALVAVVSWPLLRERVSRNGALGIALTLAGSAIIAGGDVRLRGEALHGDLLAFLGAVVFAGYLLIGRNARQRLDAISYSVPVYAICSLVLVGISFPTGQSMLAVQGRDWPVFLGLVLIPTLGGHLLYNWTLRYVTAAVVSTSFLGEPVFASLLAWVLLGQALPWPTLLGGVVVLGGIWLTARA